MAEEKLAKWQKMPTFALSIHPGRQLISGFTMKTELLKTWSTRILSYALIACIVYVGMSSLSRSHPYILTPEAFNVAFTLLFLLLVYLTSRLARTDRTGLGVLCTGIFIMLFNPGMDKCMIGDEEGLTELASQCMVPFFMMQFRRIRRKDFHYGYFLMFLMGIFCSYTHNGVAIPLCASFLWITWRHREKFFKMACWPMVIGFLIGTTLSIFTTQARNTTLPEQLLNISDTTRKALTTLWDTKVFVLSVAVTAYLLNTQSGRRMLRHTVRRNYQVCTCMAFSLLSLPLAPLGISNAVTGVCFFCMFWLLFITRYMIEKYFKVKI